MQKFDAIIIGFGKGGKTLAGYLASNGKKVALIEQDSKMYGGTCINIGCLPSKSLVKNSLLSPKEDDFAQKQAFYAKAVQEQQNLTATLRQKNYEKLNNLENVTIFNARGTFHSDKVIKLTMQGGEGEGKEALIEGEQIFINTGAKDIIPDIKGIKESKHIFTSKTLMNNATLPQHLLIIGGGFIGLEFASIYANFGSKVTLLQREKTFLKREDRDIAESIYESFKQRGIEILCGVEFVEIEDKGDRSIFKVKHNGTLLNLEGDMILSATGRAPNTQNLCCDKAGLVLDNRGAVVVNDKLQSNISHIYALGDVNGGAQFTYVSLDDYRIIVSNIRNTGYDRTKRKALPSSVFIDPPFSKVGLNEKEALEAGYEIKIGKLLSAMIPKAIVLKKPQGLLKVIINAKSNEILGAMLFCEESYEMINLIKLAMDSHISYEVLRDQIYTHPTMSEALNDLFNV